MAEVIAIIGTVGAVCNIVDVVNKTISLIADVQSTWKTADLALLSLASQLTALRAALTEIHKWLELNTEDMHHQLTMDLDVSLSCCRLLASELEAFFTRLNANTDNPLSVTEKIRVVAGGRSADDIQKFIAHQTSSLTLLLTACNCTTLSEQKKLLEKPRIRKALSRNKIDSVSLLVHRDNASFASKWSDNLSKLSYVFDFDTDLLSSKAYERVFRSSLKQLVRQRPSEVQPVKARAIEHVFVLCGPGCDNTDIIGSLCHATQDHPIQVAVVRGSNPNGLFSINKHTKPLTILYVFECDLEYDTDPSREWLATFRQLELSPKLPLVVFFSHVDGCGDTGNYKPGLQRVVRETVNEFKANAIMPFRHFDLVARKARELDQFTEDIVREVSAPEEGLVG